MLDISRPDLVFPSLRSDQFCFSTMQTNTLGEIHVRTATCKTDLLPASAPSKWCKSSQSSHCQQVRLDMRGGSSSGPQYHSYSCVSNNVTPVAPVAPVAQNTPVEPGQNSSTHPLTLNQQGQTRTLVLKRCARPGHSEKLAGLFRQKAACLSQWNNSHILTQPERDEFCFTKSQASQILTVGLEIEPSLKMCSPCMVFSSQLSSFTIKQTITSW